MDITITEEGLNTVVTFALIGIAATAMLGAYIGWEIGGSIERFLAKRKWEKEGA